LTFEFTDFSKYQLNAQFIYSSTIYMLHYAPQHVLSSTLLIIRRTNVSPQPLVSSPSVSSRTVCRWTADIKLGLWPCLAVLKHQINFTICL